MKVKRESDSVRAYADGGSVCISSGWLEVYSTNASDTAFCDRNGSAIEAGRRHVKAALMHYNVLIRQVNRSTNNRQT